MTVCRGQRWMTAEEDRGEQQEEKKRKNGRDRRQQLDGLLFIFQLGFSSFPNRTYLLEVESAPRSTSCLQNGKEEMVLIRAVRDRLY